MESNSYQREEAFTPVAQQQTNTPIPQQEASTKDIGSTIEQVLWVLIPLLGVGVYLAALNANPAKSKTGLACAGIGIFIGLTLLFVKYINATS